MTTYVSSSDEPKSDFAPLISSYNDKIRPILNKIDKLRHLNLGIEEGIPLLTIVVVGPTFSGKSSLIESLTGISLPCGYNKEAPLEIRLQNQPKHVPEFLLEYNNKTVRIMDENHLSKAIDEAIRSWISGIPFTLVVKRKGIPDLNIIDFPGDIHLDMEYIEPKESIILNVIPENFIASSHECISVSERVDKTWERSLVVVTKCDRLSFSKTYIDKYHDTFQNHIFVRNRIEYETIEEARIREVRLFETHHVLSKLNKSMVGMSALAHRINKIQLMIISRCLPDILKKITDKLSSSVMELNDLSPNLKCIPDAVTGFLEIVASFKESLQKILIRGEFDEYLDDKKMHGNARLVEMLDDFSVEFHKSFNFTDRFLVEEIEILEEANSIRLAYFFPHSAFHCLLERKVNSISKLPVEFANKVCNYLDTLCVEVLADCCGNYQHLLSSMKKATRNAVQRIKDKFMERVVEIIEMEKTTDYTCDANYIANVRKLLGNPRDRFLKVMHKPDVTTTYVEGHGKIEVKHLLAVAETKRNQAFDLKMRMTAYLNIVMKRIVDWIALQLQFWIKKLVNKEIYTEIMYECIVQFDKVEHPLHEPSPMEREKLLRSICLLKESEKVIRKAMVGIPCAID
ncbi:dynamin-related protein 4C-like protein [Tanacetum coccineum]